VRTHLLKWPNS
jgi:gas vesicle structural protein